MDSDEVEVNRVISNAQSAFDSARSATPVARAGWLQAISEDIEAAGDELVRIGSAETHLLEGRLRSELARTIFQLRLLADEIRRGMHLHEVIDRADPAWPMGARPDLRRVNEPLGVVGIFGASNFPFAFSVIGGDSASAIAAGCSVVHKAHPAHERLATRTSAIVQGALVAAGAPTGLFGLVLGRDAGEGLVDHPAVRAIAFTGSRRGGFALWNRALQRANPIPFFGELGSTNPVFVTEAAWASRSDQILTEYVHSVALGMGQFCTKPGFLVIPATSRERLAVVIESAVESVAWHPMLTPSLRDAFQGSLDALATKTGIAKLFVAAPADSDNVPPLFFLRTTAKTICESPELLEHEVFGPASVIVEYDDESELLEVARLSNGQLTTSIHANVGETVAELVGMLSARSGRVLWNGWPTGVTVSFAQQHGGPFPATTAPASTSVGTSAVARFMRPVAYQDFPSEELPGSLRDENPWGIPQRINGEWVDSVG